MARSFACRTFFQNLSLGGKDKLAGAAPTKGNNTFAMSRAPTSAIAPPVISALSSVAQYSEDDLQRIFRTVLHFRPLASPLVFVPQQYKGPCERPLKARFLNVYWGKTHLECYNFFQQCEDYFATAGVKG